ncbi:MAG TPA: DUF2865 domain-containing protein [Methyloceanibacter sp.]|nr:DUF2865 domain-containing protein [Methyloceanibacter sp.]
MNVHRHFRRILAPSVRSIGRPGALVLALGILATPSMTLAQSEQDIRCMQLQQEMAAARGGGANAGELANLDQQIGQQDRIYQGTQAAMEDSGCYERMFIFGRSLKRTPKCLNMNARVEDARRQLARLQGQQKSLQRGGGNRRRQAELQQALQRNGCSGAPSGGGGLFDFFGGPREPEYQSPIYRSINPNGRYRSVCVRLCDGFYYPISYSTYGSQLAQDADKCQANCAAPAELYVYSNPGQEIEQAISLSGSAYMDLPVALRYRKEYVNGCSCKQTEYNPTDIEAANKKAQAPDPGAQANAAGGAQAPAAAAPAVDPAQMPELDLDITGSAGPAEAAPPVQQAAPAPAPAAAQAPAPPPPAPATAQAPPAPAQGQSTIIKKPRAAAN